MLSLSVENHTWYRIVQPNENLYKMYDDVNIKLDPDDDDLYDDDEEDLDLQGL